MIRQEDIAGHVIYALRNATIRKWPFPHFFAENVWPDDFYAQMMAYLAEKTDYKGGSDYHGRTFGKVLGMPELDFMNSKDFMRDVAYIFQNELKTRYVDGKFSVYNDLRLVRDGKHYSIGPHTDAPWKVVSLLFYLPPDNIYSDLGTSIYLPGDEMPDFRCVGGPHYNPLFFKRIASMPYAKNSCFGFFKTDNSFHGVEVIQCDVQRDVLLYNIYDEALYLQSRKPPVQESTT